MDTSPQATTAIAPSPARSTFITVLAWLFIIGAGFATIVGIMQAAAMTFLMPSDEFWTSDQIPRGIENFPPAARFLFSKMQLFVVAFWLLSLVALVAGVGLLRRKNWARIILVVLFLIGIVWNLGGLWIQYQMVDFMRQPPPHAPADFARQMEVGILIMRIGSYVVAIGTSAVFAWLIHRLLSSPIKAEFHAP